MTSRDWEHGEAVLGMFLNGQAIANPGPHGEEVEDDSFVLLFNAHAEDREFKLPRRRMGTRWELELCTADPAAPPGSAPMTRRPGSTSPRTRSRSCGGWRDARTSVDRCAPPTACSSPPSSASRPRAAASPTCATSGSVTSTCPPRCRRGPGSTHGYDVVDPTRISADLGGEEAFRALAAAAHAAGLGIVLDLVPNHMAVDDANPFWADPSLRERFFDIDPATGRHRRFFDIDDLAGVRQEDPEVFEQTHALALSLVRDGVVDALRIDHPDGLADPARYFARLREDGAETVWIEKILEPSERLRDWPVTGTVGYEFLNDVCALFVDPRRRAGVHRAVAGAVRATSARSPGSPPRPSSSRPRGRSRPRSSGSPASAT